MNTELLKKIAAHIESKPESLDMWEWCGTACCIAGHAVALSGLDATYACLIEERAEELLGLTPPQSMRLFYTALWPKEFSGKFFKHERQNAHVAAARIRHFVKTNGAE